MSARWDHLLDTKPIPLLDHLLGEIAKLIAKDLSTWPLPVGEIDPATFAQFRPLFEEGAPRPSPEVYRESARLARWELERDHAAYDDYMRNRRWLEHGLAAGDKNALLLISRWLVEQLLALGESTSGRVDRKGMLQCLEQVRPPIAR